MAPIFYHQPFFLAPDTPPSPLSDTSSSSFFDSPFLCSRHRHSPTRFDNLLHLLNFQPSLPRPHDLHDSPSDLSCLTPPFHRSSDDSAVASRLRFPPPDHRAFLEEDVLIMDGFLLNEPPVKLAQKGDAEIPGSYLSPASLYKTDLCASWEQSSWCRYAAKCQFAHGKEELRPYASRHPRYKTEICKAFARSGDCLYGSRCRYIHQQPSNTISSDIQGEETKFSPLRLIQQCPSPVVDDLNVDEFDHYLKKRLPIFEQICPSCP